MGIGEGNLDEVLNKLVICDGLIIDVWNNLGGNFIIVEKLVVCFMNEKVLVGYMFYKIGLGYNDFFIFKVVWLELLLDCVCW